MQFGGTGKPPSLPKKHHLHFGHPTICFTFFPFLAFFCFDPIHYIKQLCSQQFHIHDLFQIILEIALPLTGGADKKISQQTRIK